jgi:hypothetical protein
VGEITKSAMYREIPPLSITCLKSISKAPGSCINEKMYREILTRYSIQLVDRVTQDLINHITEGGRMADHIIPILAFNSNRKILSLKNSKITGPYLIEIIQQCPHLTSIDVSGCLMIDDNYVMKFLQLCPQLEHIEIRNCRKLTDSALQSLIDHAPRVTHINIGGNFNMTELGLLSLIETHPNRQYFLSLNISGLPITEQTLTSLTLHCHLLKSLGIGYAIINEALVRSYLENCGHKLESLCISWLTPPYSLEGVSLDLLDHISKCCPRLHTLDISGLKNITSSAIGTLVDSKRTKVCLFVCQPLSVCLSHSFHLSLSFSLSLSLSLSLSVSLSLSLCLALSVCLCLPLSLSPH